MSAQIKFSSNYRPCLVVGKMEFLERDYLDGNFTGKTIRDVYYEYIDRGPETRGMDRYYLSSYAASGNLYTADGIIEKIFNLW